MVINLRNMLVLTSILGVLRVASIAQDVAAEIHVKNVRAQHAASIKSSPLCQLARKAPNGQVKAQPSVNPKTLEADLDSLMEKSDEVVLAGVETDLFDAISREDAVKYVDVKVLRSWKGPHKVGETITAILPYGILDCSQAPGERSYFESRPGGMDLTNLLGPFVLFLHKSERSGSTQLPDLRATGGNGVQGIISIRLDPRSEEAQLCTGNRPGTVERCGRYLETAQDPVRLPYARDPLAEKYNGMPVSEFLRTVRAVADSLGYVEQSAPPR
jgi:hypothetical protein